MVRTNPHHASHPAASGARAAPCPGSSSRTGATTACAETTDPTPGGACRPTDVMAGTDAASLKSAPSAAATTTATEPTPEDIGPASA